MTSAVIVDALRTASGKGKPGGQLSAIYPAALLSTLGRDAFGPAVAARYPEGLVNQGVSAELIAARWKLDRNALDEYSARSHARAAATARTGGFEGEIVPVVSGDMTITVDETVRPSTTAEGLAGLKPSFRDQALEARFPEIARFHTFAVTGSDVHHLRATGGRYGLQTMCEGGGMANATIIERL